MEIRNARITDTFFGREDHGIFTFYIFVEFGGYGCGIGGYALDTYDKEKDKRYVCNESMEAISRILETVGVDSWEKLKGQYIRVIDNGWGSTIDEIGNLMSDQWFNIREYFKSIQED